MKLFRSLTHRVQRIRVGARWLQCRLALATAGHQRWRLQLARKAARRLFKERIGYADTYARMLVAAALEQEGERSRAERAYREAIDAATRNDMLLCSEAARHRLAELTEDAGALAAARADIAARGVVVPERMVQVHLPRPQSSAD